MAWALTTAFLELNIFFVESIFKECFAYNTQMSSKIYGILLAALCGIVNYFIYRKSKFDECISYFSRHEEEYKSWNLSTSLYMILSVVIPLGYAFIHGYMVRTQMGLEP